MNTGLFSGKAEVYAKARPSYPPEAIDYIASLLPPDAAIADVGAGTGKLSELLAARGFRVFAVEPNADMRGQLAKVLSPYPNASVIDATAEATTLPGGSVDAVVCAQALHWFDLGAFRAECLRVAKGGALVIAVYNAMPGGSSVSHSKLSTGEFFSSPAIREFPNPIHYTRDGWLAYMTSHSGDPLPADPGYAGHIARMNAIFDGESSGGLLLREPVAKVYSEALRATI